MTLDLDAIEKSAKEQAENAPKTLSVFVGTDGPGCEPRRSQGIHWIGRAKDSAETVLALIAEVRRLEKQQARAGMLIETFRHWRPGKPTRPFLEAFAALAAARLGDPDR